MGSGNINKISGLDYNKQVLAQSLDQAQVTDPTRRAQILAAGLLEGDLTQNSRDSLKDGKPSSNFSAFNLNHAMIDRLGLTAQEPALNSSDQKTSYDAAVKVINAAIDTLGVEGFEAWQRGGETFANEGAAVEQEPMFAPYDQAFKNTVAWVQNTPSAATDNQRYWEDVPYYNTGV